MIFPSSTLATVVLLEVKVNSPASAGVNAAPVPIESSTSNSTVVFSTVISVGVLLMDIVAFVIVTLSSPTYVALT